MALISRGVFTFYPLLPEWMEDEQIWVQKLEVFADTVSTTLKSGNNLNDVADKPASRANLGVPAGTGTSSGTNTGDQDLSPYATSLTVTTGLALKADAAAVAAALAGKQATLSPATPSALGTMSAADKAKMDGIAAGVRAVQAGLRLAR